MDGSDGSACGAGTAALRVLMPELSHSLLAWWEVHGRKDPALKPWMFTKDGRWPEPAQHLDLYGIWIAEVMRWSAA